MLDPRMQILTKSHPVTICKACFSSAECRVAMVFRRPVVVNDLSYGTPKDAIECGSQRSIIYTKIEPHNSSWEGKKRECHP